MITGRLNAQQNLPLSAALCRGGSKPNAEASPVEQLPQTQEGLDSDGNRAATFPFGQCM
jgi:hypothetical protein